MRVCIYPCLRVLVCVRDACGLAYLYACISSFVSALIHLCVYPFVLYLKYKDF